MQLRTLSCLLLTVAACGGSKAPTSTTTPSNASTPAAKSAAATPAAMPARAPAADPAAALADLQAVCNEAKSAAAKPGSKDTRRDAFADAVRGKLTTKEGHNIYDAAGPVDDELKHATFKSGAAEMGFDWDCKPAFDVLFGPQAAVVAAADPSAELADLQLVCAEAKAAASSAGSQDRKREVFSSAVKAKLKTLEVYSTFRTLDREPVTAKYAPLSHMASYDRLTWDCKTPFESLFGPQS